MALLPCEFFPDGLGPSTEGAHAWEAGDRMIRRVLGRLPLGERSARD